MTGLGVVLHNAEGLVYAPCLMDFFYGGERSHDDPLRCAHCLLYCLTVRDFAVPIPDSDSGGQDALYGAPKECGEER